MSPNKTKISATRFPHRARRRFWLGASLAIVMSATGCSKKNPESKSVPRCGAGGEAGSDSQGADAGSGGIAGNAGASTKGGTVGRGGASTNGGTTASRGGTTASEKTLVVDRYVDLEREECKSCMTEHCIYNPESETVEEVDAFPPCAAASTVHGDGVALDGPAVGSQTRNLCIVLYNCINESGCIVLEPNPPISTTYSLRPCYCGSADPRSCLTPGVADGACKTEYENAMETMDPSVIAPNFGNRLLAGGLIEHFYGNCVTTYCFNECARPEDDGQ